MLLKLNFAVHRQFIYQVVIGVGVISKAKEA